MREEPQQALAISRLTEKGRIKLIPCRNERGRTDEGQCCTQPKGPGCLCIYFIIDQIESRRITIGAISKVPIRGSIKATNITKK